VGSKSSEARDVFISYSRSDERFVKRFAQELEDHHLSVWVDRLELQVGDQFRSRIEDGIAACKYCVVVMSPAAFQSYFVRRVELESALNRMISEKRDGFILPLLISGSADDIPLLLRTIQYMDFRNKRTTARNLATLAARIRGDEGFTGARLVKGIDVTLSGQMVGIGELKQKARRGTSFTLFYEDGLVRSMEMYTDGKADGAKAVEYDGKGRVLRITLFRGNLAVDAWTYEYSPRTGLRHYKLISLPGAKSTS
jgi:Uncharacterized protein conserved in bacteria